MDPLPSDGRFFSDNERLIKTLQACFADLVRNQEEQMKRQDNQARVQEEQAVKLQQAIEALKPKVPVTDKKTAFWSAYKTLADEHDREFQQKYSTDLDTALIFAGLFSAVASAFIIQIQPQIQPRGTRLVILLAQNLLYLSLFSTLLAALLAVLGKQWLMYYLSAGERGTIEARGLERQRKFDGIRRWKFDAVMQTFPLLLQIGLFLFSAALSIYLWTVHISLAIIVFSFTSLGFVSYTALLISTIASPDSPFQTPLVLLVTWLAPTSLWLKSRLLFNKAIAPFLWLVHGLSMACSSPNPKPRNVLPVFQAQFNQASYKEDEARDIFSPAIPEPSPEVPAVSWVLETSTDPRMINLAAEMVVHLQWPSTIDVRPQLNRLHDSLLRCFDYLRTSDGTSILVGIQDGMTLPAIHLGRAYCALRWALTSGKMQPAHQTFHYAHTDIKMLSPELTNVVRNLAGEPAVLLGDGREQATKWALRTIPSIIYPDLNSRYKHLEYFLNQFNKDIPTLDSQSFADYLFCINNFLSLNSPCDIGWINKRQFQTSLLDCIFHGLLTHLEHKTISMFTAARIIETTGLLATKEGNHVWHYENSHSTRQSIIHKFCSSVPQIHGWLDVVLATGLLTETYYPGIPSCSGDPAWIYRALDSVDNFAHTLEWDHITISGINGLFSALLHHGAAPAKQHIHLVLHALSLPGPISTTAAYLLLQENVAGWYQDVQLGSILQEADVWSSLIGAALRNGDLHQPCVVLGNTLVGIPSWQPFILEELGSWITIFFCQEAKK
ncbi:hypothetical protein MSAN_02206800 [Mycena sanguinolenta]|uniref:DUF6535 domain-containing protein n=1 Tax=Mycena sanguinolenta TaxID=230812 RepID=A0A8H6XE71_9AGAR|nr:hypothetical protein MSAN_02206800 [Mycena sanguinolenta]